MSTQRTYGRRNTKRRRLDSAITLSDNSSSEEHTPNTSVQLSQRKRPKIQVEVISRLTPSHNSSSETSVSKSEREFSSKGK